MQLRRTVVRTRCPAQWTNSVSPSHYDRASEWSILRERLDSGLSFDSAHARDLCDFEPRYGHEVKGQRASNELVRHESSLIAATCVLAIRAVADTTL
jgi:hypothetical protein